jgi:DNA-binding transcriptional MerR regulator
MNIKEFSQATGLSAYTIRYYEKIGIIRNIQRNSSGHRFFTENDITWLGFVKRLKDTGMPLDKIQQYADLREEGEHTAGSRMSLLQDHAKILAEKIRCEQNHLRKLQEKIKFYEHLVPQ